MVVLLDLDEEGFHPYCNEAGRARSLVPRLQQMASEPSSMDQLVQSLMPSGKVPTLNINLFSAALACYPVAAQLVRSLDLNTLHALARTCRQFRIILLHYHRQLVNQTLRCTNDSDLPYVRDGLGKFKQPRSPPIVIFGMVCLTSGKAATCARDLVSECRRCGIAVCRNCTIKPPSTSSLPNRHRRLCPTCLAAPLSMLTDPSMITSSPPAFTTPAYTRGFCACPEYVFLCQSCGHALGNADTTYKRIWTWRTRYSTYLGGLGTGIGEGNEGVKCGRGDNCLASKDTEMEIDCAADGVSSLVWVTTDTVQGSFSLDEPWAGGGDKAGYLTQEIEGIGGVVKKKVKKRVRIGRTVTEFEDERERAEYLGREIRRENRSWCGWCDRVIPSLEDLKNNQ